MARMVRASIAVPAAEVERAVAAFEIAGVYNSAIEWDVSEPVEELWPRHDQRAETAQVAAYLSPRSWSQIAPRLAAALRDLWDQTPPQAQAASLPNRNWRTAWHDHFTLVRIPTTPVIVVRPPHIDYQPRSDEIVIDLAPGLAFGTGLHQSTRLCLALLAETVRDGISVLDVGTGSGILAVAAARLGASSVLATDIDPLAVDAAQDTARRNRLRQQIEVRELSIPAEERFDLVVANLTADLLQGLADELVSALKPEGRLIVSGLIDRRRDEVAEAFHSHGLELWSERSEDEWRGLVFAKV